MIILYLHTMHLLYSVSEELEVKVADFGLPRDIYSRE